METSLLVGTGNYFWEVEGNFVGRAFKEDNPGIVVVVIPGVFSILSSFVDLVSKWKIIKTKLNH